MAAQEVKRNNLLDLLKLIAIAIVVAGHALVLYTDVTRTTSPVLYALTVPTFLIISAYLRARKMDKIGVKGAYEPRYLFMSFMGLLIAYLFVVVIEVIVCYPMFKKGVELPLKARIFDSVPVFLKWFVTGTLGFGSYYIPLMFELILLVPLLYLLFKKNRYFGLICCALINFAYDYAAIKLGMSGDAYRLLIFRFTLMLGFGVFLSEQKEFDKNSDRFAIAMSIIGWAYIIVNGYIYAFKFYGEMAPTSMFVAPAVYGYIYFMMKHFSGVKDHKVFIFGKASYHIFLTQMVFYFFRGNILLLLLYKKLPLAINWILTVITALVITFSIGLGFFKVETKLRKKLGIGH